MKYQGRIVNWNDKKGFGFVEINDQGERVFVHIKAFRSGSRRPVKNDLISYDLVREKNKDLKAKNVKFIRSTNERSNKSKTQRTHIVGPVFVLCFCAVLAASIITERLAISIAGLYFILSLIAFIAYAIDKSAAKNNRWRTQESTLHLLSLIGGWPGAYLAQITLRHKTKKIAFKRIYWTSVIFNLAGLFWLHTEKGSNYLNTLIKALF